MLLGVVLHSAISYQPSDAHTWFRDPFASSSWASFVGALIHTFRMPAFFVLSGFFGALLWKRRGASLMLKNRFKRIVLPFVVFLLVLQPCIKFVGTYSQRVALGEPVVLMAALDSALEASLFPESLIHLWFLYYLAWVCVIVAAAVTVIEKSGLAWPRAMGRLRTICESPWKATVCFFFLTLLPSATLGWEGLPTYTTWFPHPTMLAYYSVCYGLGWALFAADFDLSSLTRGSTALVCTGVLATLLMGAFWESEFELSRFMTGALACLSLVTLTRGLSGLFIRFASTPSAVWRYVSDSSYWVYLIHLPLSILIPCMMVNWDLPFLPKWICAMTLITLLCLATYDLAVRSTPIGRFLNGRTYERYSFKLSLVVTLLLGSGIALGMARYTPIENLPSPWKDGKTVDALLPNETLDAPKVSVATGAFGCVGVERYVVCPIPSAFKDAQKACEELDGNLAIPTSEADQERLTSLLTRLTDHKVWLGATDQAIEGAWKTVTGESLTYESWGRGEPNDYGGSEDCAVYRAQEQSWNDRGCGARLHFVCERPSPP